MARSDVHRPAEFDPSDYRVIDYLDVKRPEYQRGMTVEIYERAVAVWRERIQEHFPDFRTDGAHGIGQCNHCGHVGLRWVAVVEHVSGAKLAFGEICADRVELEGRDAFRAKFVKDRAQKEADRLERDAAQAAFREANADVVDYLGALNSDYGSGVHEFLLDMKRTLSKKGTLSEGQVAAVEKFRENERRFAERKQAEREALAGADALEEGRRTLEGEVVSVKTVDGFYGLQVKMLVRLDDGNKVYGTVPRNLEELTFSSVESGTLAVTDGPELKGQRVRFTAQVERSRDDEHFGFFKRPTKAEVMA